MDEHVLAAIRLGDEAKALRFVEPLHGASSHFETPIVSGSLDPHLPRLTPRLRSVILTGASVAGCRQRKTARESLAESEYALHIHRQPKTTGISYISPQKASQLWVN